MLWYWRHSMARKNIKLKVNEKKTAIKKIFNLKS